MEAWTGVLILYAASKLAYDHFVARKASKKAKADCDAKIIDLRERLNEHDDRLKTVEHNPLLLMGEMLARRNREEHEKKAS